MTKLIKVQDNIYEALAYKKRDGETFSEVIFRLLTLSDLLDKVQNESQAILTDTGNPEG